MSTIKLASSILRYPLAGLDRGVKKVFQQPAKVSVHEVLGQRSLSFEGVVS